MSEQITETLRQDPALLRQLADALRAQPPFDLLPEAELHGLLDQARLSYHPKGEPVNPSEGCVQLVHSGHILAEQDGLRVQRLPGERLAQGSRHRTLTDSFILEVPATDWEALAGRVPAFAAFQRAPWRQQKARLRERTRAQALDSLRSQHRPLDARLDALLRRAPVSCSRNTPLREAVRLMHETRVDSVVVIDAGERPLGIFTAHDLRLALSAEEQDLGRPLEALMTPKPHCLPRKAHAFEAAVLMARYGVRHVCLLDGERLVGVVVERDLFDTQRAGLVRLARAIREAASVQALAALRPGLERLARMLLSQGADAAQIYRLLSELDDQIVARVVELCHREAGYGLPRFSWLAFGAEARREQGLRAVQHNGLMFPDEAGMSDVVRARLEPLALRVNQALEQCGYAAHPHRAMAGNPSWCLSHSEWLAGFRRLREAENTEQLADWVDCFDMAALAGSGPAVRQLRAEAATHVATHPPLLARLAEQARAGCSAALWLEQSDQADIDLLTQGLEPLVSGVRVLALAQGVTAIGTRQRLKLLRESGAVAGAQAERWDRALELFQWLRLLQQLGLLTTHGAPVTGPVPLDALQPTERALLRQAMEAVAKLQIRLQTLQEGAPA